MKKRLKNVNKLTDEKASELKKLCIGLGMFQRRNNLGELMFKTEKPVCIGEEVIGGKKYKKMREMRVPIMVDHYENLVKIWRKDGQDGIDYYIKFFTDLKEEQEKEALQEAEQAQKEEAKIITL
jgi:hypothetical protein